MKNFSAKLLVVLGLAAAVGLMLPVTAQAAGEQYSFQDSTQKTIVGTGGAYTAPVNFNQTNGQNYQGQFNLNCQGQTTPLTVTLSLNGAADSPPVNATLTYNTPSGCDPKLDKTTTVSAAGSSDSNGNNCDIGSFNWLVCPMTSTIENGAAKIGDWILPPLLRVNPLTQQNAPGIYQAWHGVRDFANVLIVLALLVIAFANVLSFQIDAYSVKKALPRVVVAAVMVQFTFFVAGIFIDVGNVLGAGIGDLIAGFARTSGTPFHQSVQAGVFNAIGLGGGIAFVLTGALATFWPLIALMLLSLLISLAVIFLTLGARFLILYALVVLSPLAFVAWILPSTESYFRKWWTVFIRLVLMYPIIMAILAIAAQANSLVGSANQLTTGGGGIAAGIAVSILKLIVSIAAFFLIPRTFKWAGGMMTQAHSAISSAGVFGKTKLRESQWSQDQHKRFRERQLARMNRLASSPSMMSLTNSRSGAARQTGRMALGAAGFLGGGAPATDLARARMHSTLTRELGDEVEALNESPANIMDALTSVYGATAQERQAAETRVLTNAPSLRVYSQSRQGRMALVKKLADMDLLTNSMMENIRTSSQWKSDYGPALKTAGKIAPKKPAMVMRFADGERDDQGNIHRAGEVKSDTIGRMIRSWTAGKLRDDIDKENFDIAAAPNSVGNQVATQIADNLGARVAGAIFTAGSATYADPAKRRAIVDMIHAKSHIFRGSQNGRHIINSMIDAMRNDESFMDQIIGDNPSIVTWTGMDANEKAEAIRQWL